MSVRPLALTLHRKGKERLLNEFAGTLGKVIAAAGI